MNVHLAQDTFPEEGGETECRVEIDPDTSVSSDQPLHIVFCVDSSGSMSGSKIVQAKGGIMDALAELNRDDKYGVVTFSRNAKVIVDPTDGNKTRQAENKLDNISARGGTHIINGLEESREVLDSMSTGELLSSSNDRDAIKRIALVTDGKPSNISSSLRSLVSTFSGSVSGGKVEKHGAVAESLNSQGITIDTAGVGKEYGENIIETLSSRSGGEWEHHSSAQGITSFFEGEIEDARSVVIADPSLEFIPKNGVTVQDIYQSVPQITEIEYEKQEDRYRIDSVPDIRVDTPPEFLFELEIPSHDLARAVEFAEVLLETGSDQLAERVSGQFVIDNKMARDRDTGNQEIAHEADTAKNYLGRKDSMDQEEKEQMSRSIARKK